MDVSKYKMFKAGDLFTVHANPQLDKRYFTFSEGGEYPYFTRTVLNNGIAGYVDYLDDQHMTKGGVLAVGMLGMKFFYFDKDFYSGQFTKHIRPKDFALTREIALYFKAIFNKHSSLYQGGLVRDFVSLFNDTEFELPVTATGEIDFAFMENRIRELELARIRELEAYLKVTGLSDYKLTPVEEKLLADSKNGGGRTYRVRLGDLFEHIAQGRRLKKGDHIAGDTPFVMSGVTNTGLVAHVDNPINHFPGNSLTIDIFGNVFYRGYEYSASDDVGVYWSNEPRSRESLLYIASVLSRQLAGKYSYSKKLRASQSADFEVELPVDENNQPDYVYMTDFIRAQQKRAVARVAAWREREIVAARQVTRL